MDLLIDPTTKDLVFADDNISEVPVLDEISQRVSVRLRFFFQEWVLDRSEGTKWYELVLRKGVDKFTIDQHLRKRVIETQGVKNILTWNSTLKGRLFTVDFTAQTDSNEILALQLASDDI